MQSLYPFAEIMTELTKIEGQIVKLQEIFTSLEERTSTDESLIDTFVVKANELETAANALKNITFTNLNRSK
tara:strand:+ start:1486 stop:1701 length:216 start_codon:yes stop_codon:yes gene_type:complete